MEENKENENKDDLPYGKFYLTESPQIIFTKLGDIIPSLVWRTRSNSFHPWRDLPYKKPARVRSTSNVYFEDKFNVRRHYATFCNDCRVCRLRTGLFTENGQPDAHTMLMFNVCVVDKSHTVYLRGLGRVVSVKKDTELEDLEEKLKKVEIQGDTVNETNIEDVEKSILDISINDKAN